MGRMLVDDVELVLKLHKPVGSKELPQQLVAAAGLRLQKLFLKEIHLDG